MILRFAIVIPSFDNPATVESVVRDALLETPYPVRVIDDGSTQPIDALFRDPEVLAARASGRLEVHRFDENLGKGHALRFAIDLGVRQDFTHLVTIDADGQHFPREIEKLVAISKRHPRDLVIGARKFAAPNVPGASKFGRKFSNYWVGFQTGAAISDSQSGFRIYPLFPLQNLAFWTMHYDFEIEVLIRALWNGVGLHECEIDVFYPDPKERITHFDKLWDNARISLLNTLFVAVSLLKTKSPRSMAFAFGVGVFVGCLPLVGFRIWIVLLACFAFRLNAVFAVLGSRTGSLALTPFIAGVSIWIGRSVLGRSYGAMPTLGELASNAGEHFQEWWIGSLIFGSALAIVSSSAIWFFAARSRRRTELERTEPKWKGRTRGGRIGNGFLKWVMRRLGLGPAYFCLYFIIPYFYLFAPTARRSSQEYWSITRPELGFIARQVHVFKHLFRFGQVLMDRLYQGFHPDEKKFEFNSDGIDCLIDQSRGAHGLVCLASHAGAWDLAAFALKHRDFDREFHLVHFEASGLRYDDLKEADPAHLKNVKSNAGRSDPSGAGGGDPIFQMRAALASENTIGIMGDRPLGSQFELIPFFGKLAPFDVTAFRIAAACGSPLLFTFGFKANAPKRGVYEFYATAPRTYAFVPTSGLAKAEQTLAWATEYVRALEAILRRYPEQWFNFFPFWSTLPPEVASGGGRSSHYSREELRTPARRGSASAPVRSTTDGSSSGP